MPPADFRDEFRLGMHHVSQSLPRLGMLAEHHEIHGVAVMQRDADLAVGLEAADSRAETRARFDDHEGALPFVDLDALGRNDFDEHLVAGTRQRLAVEDHPGFVDQHRRRPGGLIHRVLVGPFPQDVQHQRAALGRIRRIGFRVINEMALFGRRRNATVRVGRVGPKLLQPLAVLSDDSLRPPAESENQILVPVRIPLAVFLHAARQIREAVGRGHS